MRSRLIQRSRGIQDRIGDLFNTCSSCARGNEEVNGAFIYLDIRPKGRNEKEIMDWVRRRDEYELAAASSGSNERHS